VTINRAQDFIVSSLEALKIPLITRTKQFGSEALENEIVHLILSKRFRKYAVSDKTIDQVKSAVHLAVSQSKPISAVFVFGGYKLWRLDEAPSVDFAELFALMYYAKWLKPICELYQPGVWLDFFSDDVIVPIINNVPEAEVREYQNSFNRLIHFLERYLHSNLKITFTRCGDQYSSYDDFLQELEKNKQKLLASLNGEYPIVSPEIRATIELNVKITPTQVKDENWHQKVLFVHDAYMTLSRRRPYYNCPDKFSFLAGARVGDLAGRLLLGSTKSSIMKFWVGTGVLQPKGETFDMIILSPNQLAKTKFEFEDISIKDLTEKNFQKIRIVSW